MTLDELLEFVMASPGATTVVTLIAVAIVVTVISLWDSKVPRRQRFNDWY